jgi:FlaG/FlaF family flagellin (archaellin)
VTNRDDLIALTPVELPLIAVGESATVTLDWSALGDKPYKVDWTATVDVEGDENAANDTATALTKVRRN